MRKNQTQLQKNFTFLTAVNLINLISPLVIIPWLVYKLGENGYGVIALHQYFGQFVMMLVDFGFQIYAVNEVAGRRNSKKELTQFLYNSYCIKLFIAVIVIIVVTSLIAFDQLSAELGISSVLLLGFVGNGILTSFYPGWFFHGIERIQEMILPTFLSRLLSLGLILTLVRTPEDIWIVPTAYCTGNLVLLITAHSSIKRYVTSESKPTWKEIKRIAKESLQVFWSRLIIMVYVAASPVLVKIAGGDAGVAIYSLCEKAVSLGRLPFDMFASAAYPRLARGYDKTSAQRLIKKQFAAATAGVFSALTLTWSLRDHVDSQWANYLIYMSVYLIGLIPIAMHSFIGTCVLMVNGQRKILSISIFFGLFAYLVTYALGDWIFEDQILRVITSMVMVEFGILFIRHYFSLRLKLL